MAFQRLRGAYKSLSFQNKLLLSYFALIVIPIVVLAAFFYVQSRQVTMKQAETLSEMYIEQTHSELESLVSKMLTQAQTIAYREDIRTRISKDPASTPISEQFVDVDKMEKEVQKELLIEPATYQVRIFVNDRFSYSRRRNLTYPMSSLYPEVLESLNRNPYLSILTGPNPYQALMSTDTVELFSVILPIRNMWDYSTISAVISVDFEKAKVLTLLSGAEFSGNGSVFLVREDGTVACGLSCDTGEELTEIAGKDGKTILANGAGVFVNKETLTVVSEPLWGTWQIVAVSPVKDLLTSSRNLRWQVLLFAGILGVVVYFLAYFYARSNARRINALAKKIQVVQSGDFNVNCVVDSSDEIGELQNSFNVMVRRIRNLMQEQYYLGKNLKDSEVKILQAQINPHFLYNTLDLILWTAKSGDLEKVSDIVVKLSRFYRLSLSNGSEFVTVRKELEHVRLYVQLQNLRFQTGIRLTIDAPESVLEYQIMKLLLQPIVENSILHGIMNLDDRPGSIDLSVRQEGTFLVFLVTDNGVGMEKEKVLKLMAREEIAPEGEGGYGLHNIFRRLRLYYGDSARLIFRSEPGVGTAVEIRIPLNTTEIR